MHCLRFRRSEWPWMLQ